MTFAARITRVLDYLLRERANYKDEIARLNEELAAALANDAADAQRIAEADERARLARAEADETKARLPELEAALAEDAEDDALVDAILAPIEAELPA